MPEQSKSQVLQNIWERRSLEIKLPVDSFLGRPFTHEDIDYLVNRQYPFLQIINTVTDYHNTSTPAFITLANGWVIFDYGDAMSSSCSTKKNFHQTKQGATTDGESASTAKNNAAKQSGDGSVVGKGASDGDDSEEGGASGEGGGGGVIIEGTVVWQQLETAVAMFQEAMAKGWAGAEIVDGSRLMRFYAWVVAKKLGVELRGFYPSEEQEKRYEVMLNKGRDILARRVAARKVAAKKAAAAAQAAKT
jgi:hypothetical protein